jgi:extracellular factor (EF) 3-hydroxypalmitic acid methyl ester biosynthesis protein
MGVVESRTSGGLAVLAANNPIGDAAPRVGHRGAAHVDLTGATSAFRYRPPRLEASGLLSALACELVYGGRVVGPMQVLDVSPTGLGVALTETVLGDLESTARSATMAVLLPPGTVIDEVRLLQRGTVVARERAVVVNLVRDAGLRLGLRLTSGLLDIGALQLRDAASIEQLLGQLGQARLEREQLPAPWRAAVADLAQLLKRTRDFFDELDASLDRRQSDAHEQALFAELFETWGPQYHGMLSDLHAQTTGLDPEARRHGLDYAGHLLLPLVWGGPIHRRAYEKPQGYAGDFELMRLFFATAMEGITLYSRFLHYVGQRYPMARTVVARERTMREQVQTIVTAGRPVRVLSLACGPALELQRLLSELPRVDHSVQLFLLDQDEDALACAHRALCRTLVERREALSGMELSALHFSVGQLLRPRDEAEAAVGRDVLGSMDLVYSAGLFDYLPRAVAKRLVRRLMAMLRPGGELFIGNLREDPASAFMMEHAVAWYLLYREPAQMLELAAGLPDAVETRLVFDETERCMFLHVRKAEQPVG